MRLTKSEKEVSDAKERREKANAGCKKCPCCGEEKTFDDYAANGILNKGVLSGLRYRFTFWGLVRDCYSCLSCGAEWESDPYKL